LSEYKNANKTAGEQQKNSKPIVSLRVYVIEEHCGEASLLEMPAIRNAHQPEWNWEKKKLTVELKINR